MKTATVFPVSPVGPRNSVGKEYVDPLGPFTSRADDLPEIVLYTLWGVDLLWNPNTDRVRWRQPLVEPVS